MTIVVTNAASKKPDAEVDRARTDAWMGMERAEKIPEILARRILRQITQRGMAAGDRLPSEAEMLAQFGAGRASLREALRILATCRIMAHWGSKTKAL